MTSDKTDTECQVWREAISVLLDGELAGVGERLLTDHLVRCASCRQFRSAAEKSAGRLRLRRTEPMPDLSRRVVQMIRIADRASVVRALRVALVVVALVIIGFSLPALIVGHEVRGAAHGPRHVGAFGVAYGVGLLMVALRPARARTMLAVAQVLAGALVIGSIIDIVRGEVPIVAEAAHLPEVLSVVLVWLLAIPARRRAPMAGASRRRLHLVSGAFTDADARRGRGGV